jgi:hypothetical protein
MSLSIVISYPEEFVAQQRNLVPVANEEAIISKIINGIPDYFLHKIWQILLINCKNYINNRL